MTIARAMLPFALLATLTASVPKISEEDYAGMPDTNGRSSSKKIGRPRRGN